MQGTKLSELLEVYIVKRQRLKWSTIDWTRHAWKRLLDALGDMEVVEVSSADIEDFENFLYGELAPHSVKSYLKAVRPVFQWAQRRDYRSDNPFEGFKLPKVADTEVHVFAQAELCDLHVAASQRWRALVRTAVTAGLRKSEALNLRVDDVDFSAQTITIQSHRETQDTWAWTPKNYERRVLPLTDDLSTLYCRLLAELPNGQPYLMLDEKRYWTLRQRLRNGQLKDRNRLWPDDNFSNAFRRLRESAGLKRGTYHDLRRTCLTNWSYHLPPQELQKLAGHADIATTMRYYLGIRADVLGLAKKHTIGATGLEPATS